MMINDTMHNLLTNKRETQRIKKQYARVYVFQTVLKVIVLI